VRVGDWKLIRLCCLTDDQSDALELYNLRDDLGETKNLAPQNSTKVAELNALITGFLRDAEAIVPPRNPDDDPRARSKDAATKIEGKATKRAPEPKSDPKLD